MAGGVNDGDIDMQPFTQGDSVAEAEGERDDEMLGDTAIDEEGERDRPEDTLAEFETGEAVGDGVFNDMHGFQVRGRMTMMTRPSCHGLAAPKPPENGVRERLPVMASATLTHTRGPV